MVNFDSNNQTISVKNAKYRSKIIDGDPKKLFDEITKFILNNEHLTITQKTENVIYFENRWLHILLVSGKGLRPLNFISSGTICVQTLKEGISKINYSFSFKKIKYIFTFVSILFLLTYLYFYIFLYNYQIKPLVVHLWVFPFLLVFYFYSKTRVYKTFETFLNNLKTSKLI